MVVRAQAVEDLKRLKRSFAIALGFAGLLWLIKLIELVFGLQLTSFGIYPREPGALWGILGAPLVHGSLSHLFTNSAPVVILGTLLLYGYPRSAPWVVPVLWVVTGIGVWLFARPAFHIGASGLTFGMMFFLFTAGILRWEPRAIALSMIVFFLYGGMIWGVFPSEPGVSFESHLFGAATGISLAILLRRRDPPAPRKRYSWEDEDAADDEEDAYWRQ